MMPRAKMVMRPMAPPENMLMNPTTVPSNCLKNSARAVGSMPGVGMTAPMR